MWLSKKGHIIRDWWSVWIYFIIKYGISMQKGCVVRGLDWVNFEKKNHLIQSQQFFILSTNRFVSKFKSNLVQSSGL